MSKIKLSVKRLSPGLYIQLICPWKDHPFLFNSFQIQNQQQIDTLLSLDIKNVIYFPDKSNVDPLTPNSEPEEKSNKKEEDNKLKELWSEKTQCIEEQKRYTRNLKKYETYCNHSLSAVRAINLKIPNQGEQALSEATELISSFSETLNNNQNVILQLIDKAQNGDEYHNHIFHVMILSLILGKALKLTDKELILVGLGALFHDIGIAKIPIKIVRNNPHISAEEKNYYKLHVRYALSIIDRIPSFPPIATEIVSQHHEYLDGSGYPEKLSGEKINLLTQIVTIADEFDTLCNPADKNIPRLPSQALAYLFKNKKKQLNDEILGLLIKALGIYPPSSIVQLSNQKYALVIRTSEANILQPDVLIYDPLTPKNDAPIISLSKEKLKIEKVILTATLPEEIQEYLNLRSLSNY